MITYPIDKRLTKMANEGKIPQRTCWVDSYNQITKTDISGTINTKVNSSNHYFVNVPV